MKRGLRLAAASLLFLISGCALNGSTSFRDMSTSYRDVLEAYANDNILINIVRASQHLPMTFLDMPSVIGTGSVGASAGIGGSVTSLQPNSVAGFFSAATGSSYAPSASMTVNNSFNFTQSSLDNSSFMMSFLSDIKPESIDSLTNNAVGPKSILYSLVIDYIELRDINNKSIKKWVNDPYSPDYRNFQQALYRLIDSGLSTEVVLQKQVLSAPMDVDMLNKNMQALVRAYETPGTTVLPAKGLDGKPAFQLVRITPMTRMCLTEIQNESELEDLFTDAAFCGSGEVGLSDRAANSEVRTGKTARKVSPEDKKTLVIKLRSTRNVFDFMGALVSLQTGPEKRLVQIKNSDLFQVDRRYLMDEMSDTGSFPLFIVEKNNKTSKPLVSVTYRGDTYSIPEQNAGASRQVLVLLSEILTLNKVPGSIPPSPSVLIK